MSNLNPLPLAAAARLKFLDPQKTRFFMAGATLRLTVIDECSYLKVSVVRAFPLSKPQKYFSVRDNAGEEIGMLAGLEGLDAESRRCVEAELERRYLVATIQRILDVTERFGVVEWEVDTDRGSCKFTTRDMREHVLRPFPGYYLFLDVDGNRYDVPDINKLDARSRAWLLRHL
jgi:hypothetical protein